jgi:diguanylate cyclase (GGDEF)-like protein
MTAAMTELVKRVTELEHKVATYEVMEGTFKAAKKEAEIEKTKMEALVSGLGVGVIIQDLAYKVQYENEFQQRTTGSHIGEYCYEAYEGKQEICDDCPMVHSLQDGDIHIAERSVPHESGFRYYEIISSPLRDSFGNISGGIKVVKDITQIKLMERRLLDLSLTDELTSLYNRRGFFTLIDQLLKLSKRQKQGVYMLYTDMNHLKEINDTWGHTEGDMALIDVANVLKVTFREADIIARIGGDEFVVIPIATTEDRIASMIVRLQKAVAEHNTKGNRNYTLSVSVGTAYYDPGNPCSVDELLGQADRSMYEDKKNNQKAFLGK